MSRWGEFWVWNAELEFNGLFKFENKICSKISNFLRPLNSNFEKPLTFKLFDSFKNSSNLKFQKPLDFKFLKSVKLQTNKLEVSVPCFLPIQNISLISHNIIPHNWPKLDQIFIPFPEILHLRLLNASFHLQIDMILKWML